MNSYGKIVYESKFAAVEKHIIEEAKKRALACGYIMRGAILRGMAGPKGGRIYRVPGTKRTYQASAPGEYPAVRTGGLRTSIRVAAFLTNVGGEVVARCIVGTNLIYGMFLEEGTRKMAPRPWLTRALAETRQQILDKMTNWGTPA